MQYTVSLPGFENQNVVVRMSGLGKPSLLINGNAVKTAGFKRKMLIRRDDQLEVVAEWKNSFIGDVPKLIVDNTIYQIAPPSPWYVIAWCMFPLILIFIGGALGGLCGGLACATSLSIFRLSIPLVLKFLITFFTSFAFFALYLIIVFMIYN